MRKKINYNLTKNENLILEALWKAKKPLTRSGILEVIDDKFFNENSFYKFLNGLLDKGIIKEDGIVKTGKSFGRTYMPTISKNEYNLFQMEKMSEIINPNNKTETAFILNMIKTKEFTKEEVLEIESIIKKKKEELNE